MSLARAIVMGRLGRDPEMRYGQTGTAVLKFSLATSDFKSDGKGGFTKETTWHNAVAFRDQAERWGKSLRKGQLVYIEGPLRSNEWTDRDGQQRVSWSVHVQKLEFCERRDEQNGAPPPGAQMYTGPDTYVPNQGPAGPAATGRAGAVTVTDDDCPF